MVSTTVAYAMGGAGGAGAGGEAAGMASFLPIILMFAVFYFLLIRPQQKRTKEHKNMLSALKRGDEVITAGGIFGRIHEIGDDYAILDVGGTKMKVLRSSISTLAGAIEATPIRFGEWTAPLHVSYGVREITPDAEPEALVAAADAAMFVRKRGARIVPPR